MEQKAATRARLLDAAAMLVAARGVRAATVHAIAAEAGVTSGAFYVSFGSKAELLEALLTERGNDLAGSPLVDVAANLGDRLSQQLEASPVDALLLNELLTEAGRDPAFRAVFAARLLQNVQALSERLQDEQVPTALPPYETALVLEVLVAGTISLRQVLGEALPSRLLSDAVALLRGPR